MGYRVFWDHVLIRGTTLLRMQKKYRKKVSNFHKGKLSWEKLAQTKASILGCFKHANSFGLAKKMFGK